MSIGFIKLHRKITQWEWYSDINTTRLFIHLLLTANFEDKNWRGVEIKRGQLITSLGNLSKQTSLSVRSIRTSITKLKSTSELTSKATSKFTLLTLINYSSYQDQSEESTSKKSRSRQASDKRTTTTKEGKEYKEDKNKEIGFKKPSVEEVRNYANERLSNIDPETFIDFYESKGWKIGRDPMKDWKASFRTWMKKDKSIQVGTNKKSDMKQAFVDFINN